MTAVADQGFPDRWSRKLATIFKRQSNDVTSGLTAEEVCQPVAKLAIDEFGFALAEVWSVDPPRERLTLVSRWPQNLDSPTLDTLDINTSLSGEVVETRLPNVLNEHDLWQTSGDRKFKNPPMIERLGIKSMISVPVMNIGNPHQVLFVLNFLTERDLSDVNDNRRLLFEVGRHAELLAVALETNLRERSFRVSMQLSKNLGKLERLTGQDACRTFAETAHAALETDIVSVYLEDWSQSKLVLRGEAGLSSSTQDEDDQVPQKVIDVWRANREFLANDSFGNVPASGFVEQAIADRLQSAMFVPLHDVQGRCKGVVRSVNLVSAQDDWRRAHCYDDVAIIDAMGQAFAPPLDLLVESERRDHALLTLAHELRVPIVAFRALVERMEQEYVQSDFRFRFPHFTEVNTYTNLMQRLLKEMEIVRAGPDRIQVFRKPTNMLSDVVNPAIRFIRPLIKKFGFRPEQLQHEGFEDSPRVSVDRALVTQIIFNLIENAVKYYPKKRNKKDFECVIACQVNKPKGMLEITVSDSGNGIDPNTRDKIFEYGFRGEDAHRMDVDGSGFGLWSSRQIAEKHGGELTLLNNADPTIFLLTVPLARWF